MEHPAKPPVLVAAFEHLHLRLKRLAATITGNNEDAEDTLQDAFLKLWTSNRSPASPDEASALITTTVKNLSIDRTRRRKAQPRDELPPNLPDATPFDPQAEAAEAEQTFAEVMDIVRQRLSEQQQTILRLRDYEGRSYEEIAELLQMPPSAVRVGLSRARKTVREVYRQRHHA